MPQTITVPVTDRTKWIKFGAIYAPSLSFNPDKKLFSGGSGILSGMTLTINTGPVPPQVTVAPGAFIQRGIIVDITAPQTLEFPPGSISYPLYLVAENVDEASASDVKIEFVTPAPAPESAILAEWPAAPVTAPEEPLRMSNCELRDAISAVAMLIIQRDRQVAGAGQTVFTLAPGKSYEQGKNKIWIYRNGKKLDIDNDYAETSGTSITIFMPAISGDVFEFLIFKGAPPITSIALDDLTDVTTDLANAIKDTSLLRSSPATAANPLATFADVPGIALTNLISVKKVDGTLFVGNTYNVGGPYFVNVPPPNSSITVTNSSGSAKNALLMVQAQGVQYGGGHVGGNSVGLTFSVNGTDYLPAEFETYSWKYAGTPAMAGFSVLENTGEGTTAISGFVGFVQAVTLAPGPSTIQLRYFVSVVAAPTARIYATPNCPLQMILMVPPGVA